MAAGDIVHMVTGRKPVEYHCNCEFCSVAIGELRKPEGEYYSRLERRQYYDASERGKDEGAHIAKTPLHIARWAIQQYTKVGDWVLDPTIGAGTTAVEALTQHRNAAGMEIQYAKVLKANIDRNRMNGTEARIRIGDARKIGAFLDELNIKFQLVVNNPPYSGDESMPSPAKEGRGREFRDKETTFFYKEGLPNLAFLKEGPEYWEALGYIYNDCIAHLAPGGYFVVGVKDMIRSKRPFLLHRDIALMLRDRFNMRHVGTAFLKHYPGTLFLNSYEQMHGVKPPSYQTIIVFQKD